MKNSPHKISTGHYDLGKNEIFNETFKNNEIKQVDDEEFYDNKSLTQINSKSQPKQDNEDIY